MSETAQPPLSFRTFNPGWIPALIAGFACVATIGATYFDSKDTKERVRDLEVWRGSKDVGDAQMRMDIAFIKDTVKDLRDKPPPAVQVYAVQPSMAPVPAPPPPRVGNTSP